MLRRRLFALLLCLLAVGLPLAADAAHAGMDTSHECMQQDGGSADCSGNAMANACALHCASSACVVATFSAALVAVPAARPCAREAVLTADVPVAPDTAPPKPALS
jgi:hypothetical protein